jgi:hypothetical protein
MEFGIKWILLMILRRPVDAVVIPGAAKRRPGIQGNLKIKWIPECSGMKKNLNIELKAKNLSKKEETGILAECIIDVH